MSDKPWDQQPRPFEEPSRILRPFDTITLKIDNRTNPVRVDMLPSRQLPIPFVINIFSNLISQLSAQMAAAMAGTPPSTIPPTNPGINPNGNPT